MLVSNYIAGYGLHWCIQLYGRWSCNYNRGFRSFQFTGCFQRIHQALSRGVHTVASAECVVLERKNLCVNVCVFSSSQSHCPSALASLPPPLCASLFTGNAGEPYGWLGWCEVTWRLQRAGNLACQAGQHGASRQSIKYSIQHSQFMDLIPQEKTPSKIKKESSSLPTSALQNLSWGKKKVPCEWRPESGGKTAETSLWDDW